MKINKIIYFLHGWHLIRKNSPLIRNHIEAWQHGPVVRVVYEAFKNFGDQPIGAHARFMDYATSKDEVVKFNREIDVDCKFLFKIADFYIKFSASELRNFTHSIDSPWEEALILMERGEIIRNRIPNALIQKHFFLLTQGNRTH